MVRVSILRKRTRSGSRKGKLYYIVVVRGLISGQPNWPIMHGRFTSYEKARARARRLKRRYG